MGIKTSSARLLAHLKRNNLPLDSVCMLGRQNMCMSQTQINAMCRKYSDVLKAFHKDIYCESFLKSLGAKKVYSLDASNFEGAQLIWDLNKPIPENYKNQFTCIIDGGTTEHVFNFGQAMENIMDMLSVGGYYIGFIPSNNWNGHGLYQLSPILYMQLFCEANGMKLENLYFCNAFKSKKIKELTVLDTTIRTEINGVAPNEIYVVAKKVGPRNGSIVLQQGDYEQQWERKVKESQLKARMKALLPWEWQCVIKHFGLIIYSRKLLRTVRL